VKRIITVIIFSLIPISFYLYYTKNDENALWLFVISALSLLPLAFLLAKATENLSLRFGATVGGFINATCGNLPEFIIAFVALRKGYHTMIISSLGGAIIANMLLILGLSLLIAGIKHHKVEYNPTRARAATTGLIIVSIALLAPTIYSFIAQQSMGSWSLEIQESLSWYIAIILLATYLFQLTFSLYTHRRMPGVVKQSNPYLQQEMQKDAMPWLASIIVIGICSVLIGFISHFLVGTIEEAKEALGLSEAFIGIYIIAIVGSTAEQSSAIVLAANNKMNICMEIALGSCLQIAMLVTPVLVIASMYMGTPMTMDFGLPLAVAILASVWIVSNICSHGESSWIHGVQLLMLYGILGVLFYYTPVL